MYNPTAKLIKITTEVKRIISSLVGHLTSLSSSYVCFKNLIGVIMSKMLNKKLQLPLELKFCSILSDQAGRVKGR